MLFFDNLTGKYKNLTQNVYTGDFDHALHIAAVEHPKH